MRQTPVDLFRMGNAASARMDNVRTRDVKLFEHNGDIWVLSGSGGISTFAVQGSAKNWWKLDQGTNIPNELKLINDCGDHWLWAPSDTIRLENYRAALQWIGNQFYKMS